GVGNEEEALLRLLAELRTAATGGLEHAPNLAALRTLLHDMFERIDLVRGLRVPAGAPTGDAELLVEHGPVIESDSPSLSLWLWVRGSFIAGLLPHDLGDLEPGHFADGPLVVRKT